MTSAAFELAGLSITTPSVSLRGLRSTRTAYVVAAAPSFSVWAPGTFEVAFEPRPFAGSESTKLNLVLRCGDDWEQQLVLLDAWAVTYITEHSERLLGKAAGIEEVRAKYTPLLKTSDRYASTFKAKMSQSGPGSVTVWNAEGERTAAPPLWMGHLVRPILSASMWFMPASFGLSFHLKDAIVEEIPARAFPF